MVAESNFMAFLKCLCYELGLTFRLSLAVKIATLAKQLYRPHTKVRV